MDEARVRVFRALKPLCVELSQVALQFKSKKSRGKDYVTALERLYETLQTISKNRNALDPKLSDYIFFPLSHTFRDLKDLPIRVVELALQSLQIIISRGWKAQMAPEMAKQLLLLLSYLAGGSPTEAKVKDVSEELGAAAFECLASLFEVTTNAGLGSQTHVDTDNIPLLGHTVTVVLGGVTEGPSIQVRLAALTALENMIEGIKDKEALKNVFPGIASSLTKVLSSKGNSKPSYKAITKSLNVLEKILCDVVSDEQTHSADQLNQDMSAIEEAKDKAIDPWVEATSNQVRMALANILPLRYHQRFEVRAALSQLCISILHKCRRSLHQSVGMMVDTLLVICSQVSDSDKALRFQIEGVFANDVGLLELLKTFLHDWIVALPRIMQGNDDTRKQRTIDQTSTAFKILENQNWSLDILNDSMAQNLQASVSAAIGVSSLKMVQSVPEANLAVTRLLQSGRDMKSSTTFGPVLFGESSDKVTITGLKRMAEQLKSLPASAGLQQRFAGSLEFAFGNEKLANFWLCLQLLSGSPEEDIVDQYLNISSRQNTRQLVLDEVYAFSLVILARSTFSDEERWELQALALETVAMQAYRQKTDFRPELVDALYPILERLGSENAALQQHAMTCLTIVSQACSYSDPAALIVDNADYLVNAIALKLNTFDISPQAPQVLVMMIRLCGHSLIPYLDDLVESIFAILACYHGYPKLVESLFSVLNAIVEEASKSPTPEIASNVAPSSHPKPYKPTSISALASLLRSNREISDRPTTPLPPSPPPSNTQNPTKTNPPTSTPPPPQHEDETPPLPPAPPPPHPTSKTHTLLTSITLLTPSHLTNPSPPLRTSLLTLLSTSLPLLAQPQDTFLPLAATLFPALTPRLLDTHPPTVLAAAKALTTLCRTAGDFLATRVEDLWPTLRGVFEKWEGEMREERRVQGVLGGRGRVFEGVLGLVGAVVGEVGVGGEVEEGVFEVLERLVGEGAEWGMGGKGGMGVGEARQAKEALRGNEDWVWLIEERARVRSGGKGLERPGGEFRGVSL